MTRALFRTLGSALTFLLLASVCGLAFGGTPIRNSVPASARTARDNGSVSGNTILPRVSVHYAPSPSQQQALAQLLSDQRTPSSPMYRKWLTPEQFGKRFGISAADEAAVRTWLTSQGFTGVTLSKSRTAFSFGTTVGQAERAFNTHIHAMTVQGRAHYANVTEVSIPTNLNSVIGSVRGLDDFKLHAAPKKLSPQFTWNGGQQYELAPGDIATIYNIQPLHSARITGSGMTAAVIGQSDVDMADITAYRNAFNLPNNTPTTVLVPGSPDPGKGAMDELEADLDLEVIGAVAPNASLVLVTSVNAVDSLEYAIEENIAPVLSFSYGGCETDLPLSYQQSFAYVLNEAASQGQTVVVASGDTGPASCDDSPNEKAAQDGLSTDFPANQPGVTGVGGTSFIEPLTYASGQPHSSVCH